MKVTVVTPVFNGAKTIRSCIESVKSQEYADLEHIVIDGGSTDGTMDIVREYGLTHTSEPDAGIYDAFNKGVERATGDIVHILNSDDMYTHSRSVSSVVECMSANDLELCHSYAQQIDDNGRPFRTIGKDIDRQELFAKMRVAHPATFVAKSVYRRFGAYSIGFRIAADHEFLLRIWGKVNTGFLPEVLVNMRIGGISTSQFVASYRESMAAAIINGQAPLRAYARYNYEIVKNSLLKLKP